MLLVSSLGCMLMWQFIYNVINSDNIGDNLFTFQGNFSTFEDS
jgi:hypothetical protein